MIWTVWFPVFMSAEYCSVPQLFPCQCPAISLSLFVCWIVLSFLSSTLSSRCYVFNLKPVHKPRQTKQMYGCYVLNFRVSPRQYWIWNIRDTIDHNPTHVFDGTHNVYHNNSVEKPSLEPTSTSCCSLCILVCKSHRSMFLINLRKRKRMRVCIQ